MNRILALFKNKTIYDCLKKDIEEKDKFRNSI